MLIRHIEQSDAESFLKLTKQIDGESDYMLFEAGERDISVTQQIKIIDSILRGENSTILVAEVEEELVGYLMAIGGKAKRNRHTAYLVIGILQSQRGKGIGTKLFSKLEEWAVAHDTYRLELTVVIENESAIALYKKVGFEMEGIKRCSLMIEKKCFDEYYMAKLLCN